MGRYLPDRSDPNADRYYKVGENSARIASAAAVQLPAGRTRHGERLQQLPAQAQIPAEPVAQSGPGIGRPRAERQEAVPTERSPFSGTGRDGGQRPASADGARTGPFVPRNKSSDRRSAGRSR